MKTRNDFDAIIVGGGHNGLVCAWYLTNAGLSTLILERSGEIGGAAITEEFHPGFRNSVASYTVSLLQPKVINDMQLYQHGLEVVLRKVDNFLPTQNGYLLAGRNGLTEQEIARHSLTDAAAYPKYQQTLDRVVDCLREFLLVAPPNAGGGLADIVRLLRSARIVSKLCLETQRDLLDFFTKSAADILDHYFENETVKALFAFDAVVGNFASPTAPGSAYVLLHHVFGEAAGVREAWGHAVGGMGAITQAMGRACEQLGVVIKKHSAVEQITCSQGRVTGVIVGGESVSATTVVSSVHPKVLFEHLLPASLVPEEFLQRVKRYKSHSATFRMNVALDRLPNFANAPSNLDYLTAGIVIAPSMQYMHDAWLSADQHGWSAAPIIEMLIPSTLDDSLAPSGQHVASLFCQHFKYQLPEGKTWQAERAKAADHIIATIEHYAPGFTQSIIGRQVLSPWDLEKIFSLIGGDIFHGQMSLDQLFSARPVLGAGCYRAPINRLYMCGSGTHPGDGVTGAPGHNAAQQILRDRRRWFGK